MDTGMEYLVKETGSGGALKIISTDKQDNLISVRDIIRSAAENGADLIAIFERDGVAGFPAALYATERVRRETASFRLIYGSWIETTSGTAILIPKNQHGVTTLYRMLTKAFFELAERPLNERLSAKPSAHPLVRMEEVDACREDLLCLKISQDCKAVHNLDAPQGFDLDALSRKIDLDELAATTEEVRAFPKGRYMPEIDGGADDFKEVCYAKAREIYGDPLPGAVGTRLSAELTDIIDHGYLPVFATVKILTDKAREDGVSIGYRGMVGGSLAAMLAGITEVDPLPPHYSCPHCGAYIEAGDEGAEVTETPWELPERKCPDCGAVMKRDGYGIPAEVMFGLRYDREPDIDLNVPPEYILVMKNKLEDVFGKGNVLRGGSGRPGFVHPGALHIVPEGLDPLLFTPLQRAGNSKNGEIITHFPAYLLDYPLIKIDVLAHNSLSVLNQLAEKTGVEPSSIMLDDVKMWDIFTADGGLDDIPEFGTGFARHIIQETHPHTVAELIRISALMHGTGVWMQNAEEIIGSGTAGLMELVSCRDDIFNYLMRTGVDRNTAYAVMDRVRKHRPLTNAQLDELEAHDVPDWYISSLAKIQYVFPRSHAVIYTLTSLRFLWYKAHFPEEFAEAIAGYKENYPANNS